MPTWVAGRAPLGRALRALAGRDGRGRWIRTVVVTVAVDSPPGAATFQAPASGLPPLPFGVLPLNDWAAIGFPADALISQMGGKPTIVARIRAAFGAAHIAVTATFNDPLRAQATLPALPPQAVVPGRKVTLNPQPTPPVETKIQARLRTDALRQAVDRNAIGSALNQDRAIAVPPSELQRVPPR